MTRIESIAAITGLVLVGLGLAFIYWPLGLVAVGLGLYGDQFTGRRREK